MASLGKKKCELLSEQSTTGITILICALISTTNAYLALIINTFDAITINATLTTRIHENYSIIQYEYAVQTITIAVIQQKNRGNRHNEWSDRHTSFNN